MTQEPVPVGGTVAFGDNHMPIPGTYTPPATQPSNNSNGGYSSDPNGLIAPMQPRANYDYEPSLVTEKSVDAIQAKKLEEAQAEISNLNNYYTTLANESKILGEKNARSTNSISVLSGLGGSSEAASAAASTAKANSNELAKIESQRAVAIGGLLSNIRASAVEEAKQSRLEARQSLEDRAAYREKAQSEATNHLALLAKANSGATLEGIKATLTPEEYNYIVKNAGGEAIAKAILFENRPQDTIVGKVEFIGGQAVQQIQKPDGSYAFEKVPLPEGVSPNALVEKTQNGLLYSNDGGNTWKKVFGPGENGSTSSGTGTSTGGSDKYSSDLDAIIGNTVATISSKFGQEQFQAQIAKARNDADKISTVASVVLKNAPADVKTDFSKQAIAVSSIDKAIKLLDDKTQTGAINSKKQYLFNLAGKDYDPNLAAISAYITAAIQPYRSSVTGAAWGDQEEAEYQSLFGSINYSPTELKNRLTRVKDILKAKSAQGLNAYVNPLDTYANPFASPAQQSSSYMSPAQGMVTVYSIKTGQPAQVPQDKVQAALSSGLFRQ